MRAALVSSILVVALTGCFASRPPGNVSDPGTVQRRQVAIERRVLDPVALLVVLLVGVGALIVGAIVAGTRGEPWTRRTFRPATSSVRVIGSRPIHCFHASEVCSFVYAYESAAKWLSLGSV